MRIIVRKRGKSLNADGVEGKARVRGPLGTRNKDAAKRLVHRLEIALSEGSQSALWPDLSKALPRETFLRFARHVGFIEKPVEQVPTWSLLRSSFETRMEQRLQMDKLRESTVQRYVHTLSEFEAFLSERHIRLLPDITKPVLESFKLWRMERIRKRKFSRGATGLVLDVAVLHAVFALAVESEMLVRNPVRLEGRPGENPEGGAEPFSPEHLSQLREHAGDDLLTLLLLRWTGLRGSDAVTLIWREVHFDRREIERVTRKRRKKVILPIHAELVFALEVERDRRNPGPDDCVLINPATGKPMSRPRLYERMRALGRRAGVLGAHPHRFRDTLAVDMLSRGASPYDVAKMLGDTIDTIERHYTPFVRELRERVRTILESGAECVKFPVTLASQFASKLQ
jgi:integrase